ncbi:hypothetical protein SNEBB_002445 [Seison nebaliae]|nr:hypothetical protein SNEBB_002445 [Seison nebaliae]
MEKEKMIEKTPNRYANCHRFPNFAEWRNDYFDNSLMTISNPILNENPLTTSNIRKKNGYESTQTQLKLQNQHESSSSASQQIAPHYDLARVYTSGYLYNASPDNVAENDYQKDMSYFGYLKHEFQPNISHSPHFHKTEAKNFYRTITDDLRKKQLENTVKRRMLEHYSQSPITPTANATNALVTRSSRTLSECVHKRPNCFLPPHSTNSRNYGNLSLRETGIQQRKKYDDPVHLSRFAEGAPPLPNQVPTIETTDWPAPPYTPILSCDYYLTENDDVNKKKSIEWKKEEESKYSSHTRRLTADNGHQCMIQPYHDGAIISDDEIDEETKENIKQLEIIEKKKIERIKMLEKCVEKNPFARVFIRSLKEEKNFVHERLEAERQTQRFRQSVETDMNNLDDVNQQLSVNTQNNFEINLNDNEEYEENVNKFGDGNDPILSSRTNDATHDASSIPLNYPYHYKTSPSRYERIVRPIISKNVRNSSYRVQPNGVLSPVGYRFHQLPYTDYAYQRHRAMYSSKPQSTRDCRSLPPAYRENDDKLTEILQENEELYQDEDGEVIDMNCTSVLGTPAAKSTPQLCINGNYSYPQILQLKSDIKELRKRNINRQQLEMYLRNEDFFRLFEMHKSDFVKLPSWRRIEMKKLCALF